MGGQLPYNLILELRDRYGIRAAVETGTGLGASARWLAAQFAEVWTVENDAKKYKMVVAEYGLIKNLHLLEGDSGELLPGILEKLDGPAVFWLDAHRPDTRMPDGSIAHNCPRREEVQAIVADRRTHYVIIDDARLFTGYKPEKATYVPGLWPTVEDFKADAGDRYDAAVHADMILLMPPAAREIVELWRVGELDGRYT